ncbi:hypothetical protein GYMLUDRAFT_252631 [Collybiopsis luxurians FD-317 M1]|uniref:Uncharacterized protein n=1 Tax=Collybiopsis luxurians FD-317 M1 TaxID=944289 RepID=A0A0D0C7R0_9AGAR|nr:hypothetical protein GYMLUDRAFT_252631 [Collybiopsis luxurians FD-317 M1]
MTLLHSYAKGVGFRRWLLRSDCPPLLKQCHNLLNKVYNFSPSDGTSVAEPHPKKIPSQLAKLLGSSDHRTIHLHSRIEAPTGAYAVKGTPGRGNSFVCFRLSGEREWKAGEILYIFEQGNKVKIVLQQLVELDQPEQDPFCGWWGGGFEAKLVSASVSSDLKIIDQECIVGHAAYWNLVDGLAAVVNLSQVKDSVTVKESKIHDRLLQE